MTFKMAYFCFFTSGGNLDFLYFRYKKIYNIDYRMEWLKLLDSPSPWTAALSRRSCSGSPLSRSDSGASARNEGTDCNMGHSPAPYPWRGPLTHRGSSSGAGIRAAVGIALVECRHGSKPLKWINHLEWIKRKSNCHQALKLKEAKDLNDQHNKL